MKKNKKSSNMLLNKSTIKNLGKNVYAGVVTELFTCPWSTEPCNKIKLRTFGVGFC